MFQLILSKKTWFHKKDYSEILWEEFIYFVNFEEMTFDFYARSKFVMSHRLEKSSLTALLPAFESST